MAADTNAEMDEYKACFNEFAHLMGRRFKRKKTLTMDFQYKKGAIDVDYKTTHLSIKLPKYVLAKDKIANLLAKKHSLLQELGTLRHRMLAEEHASQKDMAAFTAKAQEIEDVNSVLEDVRGRLLEQRQKMGQAIEDIQRRVTEVKQLQAPLLEAIGSEPDDGLRSQRITQYLQVGLDGNVADAYRELKGAEKIRFMPEWVMVKTPSCKRRKGSKPTTAVVVEVEEKVIVPKPEAEPTPPKKKPAKVKSEAKEKAKAKLAKDILEKSGFKFKTKEECMSRKRLADYYMSKEDIVDLIGKTPAVAEHMPKGFKSMSKEGLCDILFALPE